MIGVLLFYFMFAMYPNADRPKCTNCMQEIRGVVIHCAECDDFPICPVVSSFTATNNIYDLHDLLQ